ncbi:hypothetical protein EDD15DRAFT_1179496 [Pisolithus albus]|nr:hypothetical protein EDD15DRAFT_1179496 [Pisolithus albus]
MLVCRTTNFFLVLGLRLGGDAHPLNSYFISIQMDVLVAMDLWQHPQRNEGRWEDIFVRKTS